MPIKPERLKEAARRLREEANAASGSVEEYIKKKLEAARMVALKKSKTREMPTFVASKDVSEIERESQKHRNRAEQLRRYAKEQAEMSSADFPGLDFGKVNHERLATLRRAEEEDKIANAIKSGDIGVSAPNCIATALDNYGHQYIEVDNRAFMGDPGKSGFIQIPVSDAQPGDVVQSLSKDLGSWEGTGKYDEFRGAFPYHGMILDSYSNDGRPMFNYSRGGYGADDIVRSGPYMSNSFNDSNYAAYRFVGTPADSTRWRQEFDSVQFGCGGKKYPGGGKFFRTNLQNESPLMYQPMMPINYPIETPLRFRPQPDLGDYQAPASTGMVVDYPINLPSRTPVVVQDSVSAPVVVEAPVENLFSDEMIARRALKQRYAESAFNDKAKSKAGAQGAWQIMPITLKDYLGRGRGKAGDLNNPEYNRKVRDWVMKIIPRDLGEFYSEDDAPLAKLAKLYGAYNWGAGNMRKYLRKQRDAGVDIANDTSWVEGLNPETRRYIKYLAFDEDIPDSTYTNDAFVEAATKKGYLKNGGNLYGNGGPGVNGPAAPLQSAKALAKSLWNTYLVDYANNGRMFGYPTHLDILPRYIFGPYNEKFGSMKKGDRDDTLRRALFAKYFGIDPDRVNVKPEQYLVESRYRPSNETNPDSKYYTFIPETGGTRWTRSDLVDDFESTAGNFKYDIGEDENGRYISMYDSWDLNPFEELLGNGSKDFFKKYGANAVELYDRIYEKDNPNLFSKAYDYGVDYGFIKDENSMSSGGKIHIKPENRGKFTALKERTGHSASWFKEHGTPAQKKMAVFELNSRHWGNRKDEGGVNLIAEYPEGYNGELRQGKSFNAWNRYLANHPMAGHRLRKAKTLLLDAARVHPLTSFATDVYDSYVGPQDESDKITTPLGVVGRGGDIILNTVKQAGEIEPNMKKVFGRSAFGRLVSLPDFIDDSLKFVRDFAEPVTSFENGGYLLGHVYDLSEEQVSELIRQGYEVERV